MYPRPSTNTKASLTILKTGRACPPCLCELPDGNGNGICGKTGSVSSKTERRNKDGGVRTISAWDSGRLVSFSGVFSVHGGRHFWQNGTRSATYAIWQLTQTGGHARPVFKMRADTPHLPFAKSLCCPSLNDTKTHAMDGRRHHQAITGCQLRTKQGCAEASAQTASTNPRRRPSITKLADLSPSRPSSKSFFLDLGHNSTTRVKNDAHL
ncbi:hypothetical protein PIB30_000723 [Stylosanthes scabra]|uniref:Uncharacterized protein n=1 Tax=Stylosanthes scabra TaxID=79078 RepID=A0ABU6YZC2_9FABA|nr:hypothetical protein [Stylosanthes scabra]